MAHIHLCFLWHMHQPFYKDLVSGEYKLPWTRMHALKDYYGMVRILEEFRDIRQTFNLVPSMMVQVEEYAAGTAVDPFLQIALKPAESLTDPEREFLLRHSFYSDPQHMIYRYPRYRELFDARNAQRDSGLRNLFGAQDASSGTIGFWLLGFFYGPLLPGILGTILLLLAEPGFLRHIAECDVAPAVLATAIVTIVVPQPHRSSFVRFWRAIRFVCAIHGAEQIMLRRPLHVISDDQIEFAIVVIVDPGGAGAELVRAPEACRFRHVGERSIAVVV